MPLLDHFHPPLSDGYPWSSIHSAWMTLIADRLNQILPAEYVAMEQVHVGPSVEIDVATFGRGDRPPSRPYTPAWNGGVALAPPPVFTAAEPAATVPAVFADDFEIRVVGERSGHHLVAAIELVSAGNKDRPETRRAFAVKCANYLHNGVCVIVVDIVTTRRADLHRETMSLLNLPDTVAPIPGRSELYATAYRPIRRGERTEVDIWAEPAAIGSPLPTLPLWLNVIEVIPVELETTYVDACRRRRIEL